MSTTLPRPVEESKGRKNSVRKVKAPFRLTTNEPARQELVVLGLVSAGEPMDGRSGTAL